VARDLCETGSVLCFAKRSVAQYGRGVVILARLQLRGSIAALVGQLEQCAVNSRLSYSHGELLCVGRWWCESGRRRGGAS
jgi:hypothetical protein